MLSGLRIGDPWILLRLNGYPTREYSSKLTRNLDPNARVMAFVGGQNVFKACRKNYAHGYVHPLLLAHQVLNGRQLCSVRYYSGIHYP